MKKFLAIYLGTPSAMERAGWNSMDPAKRKQLEATGIKAWGDWMNKHKAAVVETGAPLGKTKRVSAKGVTETKN